MADAVNVNHAFVSEKADSADGSIVSKNEWNAPEVFSGGQDGQPLIKDSTKSTGAKWGQASTFNVPGSTYSGASPSGSLCQATIQVTDKCVVQGIIQVNCTLSTGSTFNVAIRRNGATLATYAMRADSNVSTAAFAVTETVPGSVVYDMIASTGGATFTALNMTVTYFTTAVP